MRASGKAEEAEARRAGAAILRERQTPSQSHPAGARWAGEGPAVRQCLGSGVFVGGARCGFEISHKNIEVFLKLYDIPLEFFIKK